MSENIKEMIKHAREGNLVNFEKVYVAELDSSLAEGLAAKRKEVISEVFGIKTVNEDEEIDENVDENIDEELTNSEDE